MTARILARLIGEGAKPNRLDGRTDPGSAKNASTGFPVARGRQGGDGGAADSAPGHDPTPARVTDLHRRRRIRTIQDRAPHVPGRDLLAAAHDGIVGECARRRRARGRRSAGR